MDELVDVLALLTIVLFCVVGAELTRRTCRRQLLAAPTRPRDSAPALTDRLD